MLHFTLISIISAHAILKYPSPRRNGRMSFEGDGIKIANFPPRLDQMSGCLESQPVNPIETFTVGDSIALQWEITIPHVSDPGVRVAIQFPGEQMQILKDNVNVNDLTTSVVIPQTNANRAVLQWSWASQEDGGFYMACSDIQIRSRRSTATTTKRSSPTTVSTPLSSADLKHLSFLVFFLYLVI